MTEDRFFVREMTGRFRAYFREGRGDYEGLIFLGITDEWLESTGKGKTLGERPYRAGLYNTEELVQLARWQVEELEIVCDRHLVVHSLDQNPDTIGPVADGGLDARRITLKNLEQRLDDIKQARELLAMKAELRAEMKGEPLIQHLREQKDFALEEAEKLAEERKDVLRLRDSAAAEMERIRASTRDQLGEVLDDIKAQFDAGALGTSEQERYLFYQRGGLRIIAFEGEQFKLRDSKGLQRLARLLGSPGRPHHVTTIDDLSSPGGEISTRDQFENDLFVDWVQEQRAVTDETGADIANKLARLADERGEAERRGDLAAIRRIDAEEQFTEGDISKFRTDHKMEIEKIRKRVYKTINDARLKIRDHDPDLYQHLMDYLQLGTWCEYNPPKRILWKTSEERKK